jgi:hypothetical protein
MRLLHQANIGDLSITFYLPAGSYGGFLIDYQGVNAGGNTITRDDLGQVNFTMNGTPIINTDAEFLSHLADLKSGFIQFASAIGAAFNATLYIPCGTFTDENNCYIISKEDSVYFKLDFPLAGGLAASGTVKIYGIDKQGIQNYIYNLAQRHVVAQGVGTIADVHRLDNVGQMYLKNHSVIDTVRITRDNLTYFDCITDDAKGLSDFFNRVETGANALIELDMNLSKDVKEVLSREILFNYFFNGAGTLEQYFAYKTLTPNKAVKSQVMVAQNLAKKISDSIVNAQPLIIDLKNYSNGSPVPPRNVEGLKESAYMNDRT